MEEKKKKTKLMIIIPIVIVVIIAVMGIVEFTNKDKGTRDNKTEESKTPEITYKIGDTVSTDIAEFTLNDSQLTIALSNTNDETYYLPKEYNAERDARNPYVASTGRTLVYIDFTLSAIDRSQVNTKVPFTVDYNGKDYFCTSNTGYEKKIKSSRYTINNEWKKFSSSNILLFTNESSQFRGYGSIEVNIDNLKDKYYITFELPNSEGKTQDFTYVINAESGS